MLKITIPNKKLLALVPIFLIAAVIIVILNNSKPKVINMYTDNSSKIQPKGNNTFIRAVRVDLSSMPIKADSDTEIANILTKISNSGANTVYLSVWSDGYANYKSKIAPLNKRGENKFVEKFISKAKELDIKVIAWFVVGKDNFNPDKNPEWFAKTLDGRKYYQEDEPGINLPFASLANVEYKNYHESLIQEVTTLDIDGWVISEPLIGWGDKNDTNAYTDFSESAINQFNQIYGVPFSKNVLQNTNSDIYKNWVNFRSEIVISFVKGTINKIRETKNIPVIITVFTEPNISGELKSFDELKEWLGEDIHALLSLKPDYIEIQDLFKHFEYPQKPEWTRDFIKNFQSQLSVNIPLLVSIQGFDGEQLVSEKEFSEAIVTAKNENIEGISFYAYHTLNDKKWSILPESWK